MKKIRFIDTFAGIGGFHLGITQALETLGIETECVAAIEFNREAAKIYELNFGLNPFGDITKTDLKALPEHDLLVGGFPCQPFSKAGKYHRDPENKGVVNFEEDERSVLFTNLIEILQHHRPTNFIFENVKGLLSAKNADGSLFLTDFLTILDEIDYHVSYKVVNSADFGLPQRRERVFFVGQKKEAGELKFSFPSSVKEFRVVADILEKDVTDERLFATHLWRNWKVLDVVKPEAQMRKNHTQVKGTPRLRAMEEVVNNYKGKRDRIRSTIHLGSIEGDTPSGISRQGDRVYNINGLAPTLLTSTQTLFDMDSIDSAHWRVLTSREFARLQGFPEEYQIHDKHSVARKQFGNAVSVPVIKNLILQLYSNITGDSNDNETTTNT